MTFPSSFRMFDDVALDAGEWELILRRLARRTGWMTFLKSTALSCPSISGLPRLNSDLVQNELPLAGIGSGGFRPPNRCPCILALPRCGLRH